MIGGRVASATWERALGKTCVALLARFGRLWLVGDVVADSANNVRYSRSNRMPDWVVTVALRSRSCFMVTRITWPNSATAAR